MWPFNLFKKKEKTSTVPPPTVAPPMKPVEPSTVYNCIYKSIIADLDELNIADWKFEYENSNWEYFHNIKKNYSIKCFDDGKEAWLLDIHYDNFSQRQQNILYRKCQDLWHRMQDEKDKIRKAQEVEQMKLKFPQCFN